MTVVATGLGQEIADVEPRRRVRSVPPAATAARNPVVEKNYAELDSPAIDRKRAVGDGIQEPSEDLVELLDIPTFLRQQHD